MEADFASAAMLRLVAAGLARQGLPLSLPVPTGAHVPRGDKRGVLDMIMARHGIGPVLRIADAVSELAHEPLLQALLRAADAADLFDRWRRLEVFSHSRHRLVVTHTDGDAFQITHRDRSGGADPSPAETVLVVAVVTILAETVSASPVRLMGRDGMPVRSDRAWVAKGVPLPPFSLDVPSERPERRGHTRVEPDAPDLGGKIRRRIMDDPLRRWSVARMAATLGLSSRSLQRRLAVDGRPFSILIAEARLRAASELLCSAPAASLAEIGFRSGYADQSHMTREFKRAVGIPPARFRAEFGAKALGQGPGG